MKKKILIDKNALKELNYFLQNVQIKFNTYFEVLKNEGKLNFPEAKKITKDLFELRVKYKGE
jgi:hypothetical protein